MKKHIIKLGIIGSTLIPIFALAQSTTNFFDTIYTISTQISDIINLLLPVVFGMAILAFFYGIFLYIFTQGADDKAQGKQVMLWSLVAIFVMASLFGIIQVAQTTLGISNTGNTPSNIPQI